LRGELRRGCHYFTIIIYIKRVREREREALSYVEAAEEREREIQSGRKKKEKKRPPMLSLLALSRT